MTALVAALLQCAVFGGAYGAICSLIYVGFGSIAEGIGQRNLLAPLIVFPIAVPYALMFGFPAGFMAGLIGGALGGPFGWTIGGIVGPAVACVLLLQNMSAMAALTIASGPSLMGAAVGWVLGWDLRRRPPAVPGGQGIAERVYRSPLGGWAGWRRRRAA